MARKNYQTKQKKAIMEFLMSTRGQHITVAQISEHLESIQNPVGTATIYRCLESLAAENLVKKYVLDGNAAACYQFEGEGCCEEKGYFHFRCALCGALFHFECPELVALHTHLVDSHRFNVDLLHTVFYGKCDRCLQSEC